MNIENIAMETDLDKVHAFLKQNTQQASHCNCTVIVMFTCSSSKPDIYMSVTNILQHVIYSIGTNTGWCYLIDLIMTWCETKYHIKETFMYFCMITHRFHISSDLWVQLCHEGSLACAYDSPRGEGPLPHLWQAPVCCLHHRSHEGAQPVTAPRLPPL